MAIKSFNSLTAKRVPAGTNNSLLEDFLLAKHKHTNWSRFPLQRRGFDGQKYRAPQEPLHKELDEAVVEVV
jgi:hypothetical protein